MNTQSFSHLPLIFTSCLLAYSAFIIFYKNWVIRKAINEIKVLKVKSEHLQNEINTLESAVKMNHRTIEVLKENLRVKETYIHQKTVLKIISNPPKFKIGDEIGNKRIVHIAKHILQCPLKSFKLG